ncbi:hypothetical protein DFJ73DRAFT_935542 [Zopfochytrium polystomum]|nr:hypothetical protein DFJ73DRAFT_935542 [Zopfochytrium polystomum]
MYIPNILKHVHYKLTLELQELVLQVRRSVFFGRLCGLFVPPAAAAVSPTSSPSLAPQPLEPATTGMKQSAAIVSPTFALLNADMMRSMSWTGCGGGGGSPIAVPVNSWLATAEVEYCLRDTAPNVVFVNKERLDAYAPALDRPSEGRHRAISYLFSHSSVLDCAVLRVPDRVLGELVAAISAPPRPPPRAPSPFATSRTFAALGVL